MDSTQNREVTATPEFFRILVVALIVGFVSSFGAAWYSGLFERAQELLYQEVPRHFGWTDVPAWWAGVVLFAGAGIVALARRLPGATGDGPLTGFHFTSPIRFAMGTLIAAFATLSCGFALGPEGPLVILGSAIGGLIMRNRGSEAMRLGMFLGGIAAIGSVFGNPLVSGFMVLEFVAIGLAPAVLILPAFIALASGFLVEVGVAGWPGLGVHNLSVPGIAPYTSLRVGDLLFGVLVAAVSGVIAILARRGGLRTDIAARRRPLGVLFTAAAVTVGMLAIAQSGFGLQADTVLFSGATGIPEILKQTSVAAVIAALGCKLVAYAVALGGGYRGGAIFPAAFLGVAVAVLASLTIGASVTAMAAAGIAATAAAMTKLPATSALLAALLLTGSTGTVAPFAIYGAAIGILIRLAVDKRFPEPAIAAEPLMTEPSGLTD
jgi:H+/Cl- antiporter ClcA